MEMHEDTQNIKIENHDTAGENPAMIETASADHTPCSNKKPFSKKWLFVIIPASVILVLAIVVAFIWQPVLYAVSPEAYLAVAMNHTANAAKKRAKGTPSELLSKGLSYIPNGSADISANLTQNGQTVNMKLITAADRASKRFYVSANAYADKEHVNFQYYSDKKDMILYLNNQDESLAYSVPYDDIDSLMAQSALGQALGSDKSNKLAQLILETRLLTTSIWEYEEVLEPYMDAFNQEFQKIKLNSQQEEKTIQGTKANYKVFRYQIPAQNLLDLGLAVVEEMEERGESGNNRNIVYFLDGFFRGLNGETEKSETFSDAIYYIKRQLRKLKNELGFDLDLKYYVDGLNIVQTEIRLTPKPGISIGTTIFNYYTAPKTGEQTIEMITTIGANRIHTKERTFVKKEGGRIVQTTVTDSSVDGQAISTTSVMSWNQKTGELTMEQQDVTTTAFLKESGGEITFKMDDISAFISDTASSVAGNITGSIEATFRKDRAVTKPEAKSIFDLKDGELNDLLRLLQRHVFKEKLIENTQKVDDQTNLLPEEFYNQVVTKVNSFISFYEVDLVVVIGWDLGDPQTYADRYYEEHFCGMGKRDSGYLILYDEMNGKSVIRPYGICSEWLTEKELNEIAGYFSRYNQNISAEFAFDFVIECLHNDVYPHYVKSIS